MKKLTTISMMVVASMLAGTGCDTWGMEDDKSAREQWGSNDDPSRFDDDLEYKLTELPMEGEAEPIPWTGSYWPTAEDSINVLWDGSSSQSTSAKFGEAFGISGLEDAVSQHHGIDSQSNRTECTTDSQCNSDIGESCSIREGATEGRCIPTWWGLCHGWAPAAIMEDEPEHDVEYNGVTFKVNDLKALATLMYTSTNVKFLSSRCNDDDSQDEIEYDPYNRPQGDCRDTNPGTFHVIAANYLGIRGESFVEDRTFDDEVWNQPMRGFKVTKLEEITGLEANSLVGVEATDVEEDHQEGEVAKSDWKHFGPYDLVDGMGLKAAMTGDGDADLYVAFDAQPTSSSYECRPYSGSSNESCDVTASGSAQQVFVSVNGYSDTSTFKLDVTYGGNAAEDYIFNNDAVSFRHVKMDSKYITEAASSVDGNLSGSINSYTRTDHYEYVLELDGDGRITGGEWVGESKKNHPDFLWLPYAHGGASMAGGKINMDKVEMLLDMSTSNNQPASDDDDDDDNGGSAEEAVDSQTGTVAQDEWKHFGPYDVAEGDLVALMTGSGDADLYVKVGSQPTSDSYDCRPYDSGSDEECTVDGPGQIYVSINGYETSSNFDLTVTYMTGN